MKLSALFENAHSSVENKAYESPASEIKNRLSRIKFLNKEIARLRIRRSKNHEELGAYVLSVSGNTVNVTHVSDPIWLTPAVKRYEAVKVAINDRIKQILSTIETFNHNITKLKNPEALQTLDAQKTANVKLGLSDNLTSVEYVPRSSTIPTGLFNPCRYAAARDRFAGRPWNYKKWTGKQLQWYQAYSDLLVRIKQPGFTKLYSSRSLGKEGKPRFILLGANDDFVCSFETSMSQALYIKGNKTQVKYTIAEVTSGALDSFFIREFQATRY